ncbi:MAG: NAD-dependent epimerase/dehydratase family protein [Candidatus Binatia bacterium]
MNVLVTGGAGFIGSAVARALLERGDDVRIFDNFLTGSKEVIPPGTEVVEGDLRDLGAVREACSGVELVVHEGAVPRVPRSVDDPTLSVEVNVMGTTNVLVAAREAGVRRVVNASSSSVFGEWDEGAQREDVAPLPVSPYAASKLAAEHLCRIWSSLYGLETVSLRYFNVFGPGQPPEAKYALVFPAFVGPLLRGEAPEIHWDGEQRRDFTYIEDVVRATLLAGDAPDATDGVVINVGSHSPKTINEVYRAVSDALGVHLEPRHAPKRAGDVRNTYADITRARQILGWEPRSDWDTAVSDTVRWLVERLKP